MFRYLPAILIYSLFVPVHAQSLMEETVVTATRGEQRLGRIPAAVSVIGEDEIQQGQQQLTLDESLAKVPGVFMQNRHNFSQAQRISIRGFGARSPFGIRGIRLIIDGVPATMPDGQGNVDEIDLGSARRIEVVRGPSSSLYGTASGGVISIMTEDGPENPYIQGRFTLGQYGFRQYQLKTGGQFQSLNYVVSGSILELDGYRENAFVDRKSLNSKFRYDIDASSDLTLTLNLLDIPKMGDPGALNAAEAVNNRRAANPGSLNFNGSEGRSQQRLGLVYRKEFGEKHQITLKNYYTQLDFENKLPFSGGIPRSNGGQVEFDRLFIGGGGQYTYSDNVLDYGFRFIAGFDLDYQKDDRRRFVNLAGGSRGNLSMDQREEVLGGGLYAQSEFSILENLQLTLGLRYDDIDFEVTDRFLLNNSGDDSGSGNFDRLSPRVGLLWDPARWVNFYFNFSTAFETPTTTEFSNPDGGGFNPDLSTQTANSFEVGMKGAFSGSLPVDYEISLFQIGVDDELIPFEVDGFTGRTFYQNAGESTRKGIEVGLSAELLPVLSASIAYSYINARFDQFRTTTDIFDDNRIPGIPNQHFHAELRYDNPRGWYSVWDVLHVNSFFADNRNLVKTDPYTVSNWRLGYKMELDNWMISPFMSVNNIFNESYDSNTRINAGFGRYYEPAPLRNIYGGLTARLMF